MAPGRFRPLGCGYAVVRARTHRRPDVFRSPAGVALVRRLSYVDGGFVVLLQQGQPGIAQDASVLFLDIEGFAAMTEKYPYEAINRTIEHTFSI